MIQLSPDKKKTKETLSEVNVSNQKLDVSAESNNCPTGYDPYWWKWATAKRPTENFVSSLAPLFPQTPPKAKINVELGSPFNHHIKELEVMSPN